MPRLMDDEVEGDGDGATGGEDDDVTALARDFCSALAV